MIFRATKAVAAIAEEVGSGVVEEKAANNAPKNGSHKVQIFGNLLRDQDFCKRVGPLALIWLCA